MGMYGMRVEVESGYAGMTEDGPSAGGVCW